MKKWIKPIVALLLLTGIITLARYFELDQKLVDIKDWIGEQGIWAPVFFVGLYVLATVAALPGSVLTIAAGALFGSVLGVTTVIIGATNWCVIEFFNCALRSKRYHSRNAFKKREVSKVESTYREKWRYYRCHYPFGPNFPLQFT